jgi:hypothetical protein
MGVQRVNPTVIFLVSLVLVIAALFIPGPVGGVLLLVVAGAAAVLLVTTWDRLPPAGRAARLLVLGVILGLTLSRFF